jgi:hypothetical protein
MKATIFRGSKTPVLAIVAAAAFLLSAAVPALAGNTVTQEVTCPTSGRTASLSDLSLANIVYAGTDQVRPGTVALAAADLTCTGNGWNVTVLASSFSYSGTGSDPVLTAANLALTSAAVPAVVSGQGINPTKGPKVVTTSGALDTGRKVIQAQTNAGQGSYSQALGLSLTIPAYSPAGTYTTTITSTITAGP